MIRVTGNSSLMMNPLEAMAQTDTTESMEKLKRILTGSSSSNGNMNIPSEYKEIRDIIGKLSDFADVLTDASGSSIFAKAEVSGDTSVVVSKGTDFIDQYNNLLKALEKVGTDATKGYAKELSGIISDNKELLEKAGISISKNGTLSVDQEKLAATSIEDLKKIFMGTSSVAGKIADKSVYVGASVVANAYLSSYGGTGNYNAKGADYGQMESLIGGYLNSLG